MDEAIDAGDDVGEGTERGHTDDGGVDNVADFISLGKDDPGVVLVFLVAKRDALVFEGLDVNFDSVADVQNFRRMLDALPGEFGDVDHAVDAADVDESTIGSEGFDDAGEGLTFFRSLPELLAGRLALFLENVSDGTNSTFSRLGKLDDLETNAGVAQVFEGLASAGSGKRTGDEDAGTLIGGGDDAALVDVGDGTFDDGTLFSSSLQLAPGVGAVETFLGQHDGAFGVVGLHDDAVDGVANFDVGRGVNSRVIAVLVVLNVTGLFSADVDLDLGSGDTNNSAFDAAVGGHVAEALFEHRFKIFVFFGHGFYFFGHGLKYLLYCCRRCRRSCSDTNGVSSLKKRRIELRRILNEQSLTVFPANIVEFDSVGTVPATDNYHSVYLFGKYFSFMLAFFGSFTYCTKNGSVCT